MMLQDNYKITLLEVLNYQDFSLSYTCLIDDHLFAFSEGFYKTFLFVIKIEQLITPSLCERRVALAVLSVLF